MALQQALQQVLRIARRGLTCTFATLREPQWISTPADVASLAPDGRVILVEYRGEDPSIGIKPLHTMNVAQVTREMAAVGLELQANSAVLPKQHLLSFRRAATR